MPRSIRKTLSRLALPLGVISALLVGGDARASLVYTFVGDSSSSGSPPSGSLIVSDSVRTTGVITSADILSFNFSFGSTTYTNLNSTAYATEVAVDSTGAFATPRENGGTLSFVQNSTATSLTIAANDSYSVPGGEDWTAYIPAPPPFYRYTAGQGTGHWQIANTVAVPEPSSLMLVGGGLGLAALASWPRRRQVKAA